MASYNFNDRWWLEWLPPKYKEIISKAVSPMIFSSYADIYIWLYYGIHIEGGTQKLWLDYSTDKVILMVSAKALDINGGLDSRLWQWVTNVDSRFDQAAEAKDVEWFEVWQSIQSTILSPNTKYRVSFVLKIDKNSMNHCPTPFCFSIKRNGGQPMDSYIYMDDLQRPLSDRSKTKTTFRSSQKGWMEFVLGDFRSAADGLLCVEVSMKNTDRSFRKKGIIIDGVKLNPMD